MGKLIVFLLIVFALYLLFRGKPAPRNKGDVAPKPGERMINCAHCGVFLPESESVADGGRFFCSEEHRRLGG